MSNNIKLPKQYFSNYKLDWGKKISLTLANGDSGEDYFTISLDMETSEVIANPDGENFSSYYFGVNEPVNCIHCEVDIYEGSYIGELEIWTDEDSDPYWGIRCHEEFLDLQDGELPVGATGDDIYEAIGGDGKAICELYSYIKSLNK
ncbi:hypothetical protein N9K85_03925 [Flavobacteriaceae bacterium]|nr:hypothetical protein [Flavobacteriaceae bacterium]